MQSVTTDNASSNAKFIEELCKLTKNYGAPFEEGKWIRCFAHIIHLAAQDSIEYIEEDVKKVILSTLNAFSVFG